MRHLIILMLIVCVVPVWGADQTWDGGSGANDDWTTNQNWGNNNEPNGTSDGATMAGSTRLTPNLDANVSLNRLTFAVGAGNFTIGGTSTLTLGGTTPIIEVLAGAQTISSQFALAADLTVYVASGASLSISDASITGAYRITKIGSGTLTVTDAATPGAPSFSAPASDGQTTADTTPTWTWSSAGGGSGVFSYRIDNGAWTDTNATSFTPGGALGNGSHTLEVREYSRVGAVSATASRAWSVDGSAPYIVSRTTIDADVDGQIDAIDVVMSEAMGTATGTWTVAGYTVGTPTWPTTTRLRIPVTEKATPDTGALPAVRYQSGAVADAAGNALPTEGAGTPPADGAAPVITGFSGTFGSTSATIVFSEPVGTSTTGTGNLVAGDFTYTPGTTSISGFSDANGLDQSVGITTNVGVASGDTIAAVATSIYDVAGNAVGTTTKAITQPTATKDTAQAGDWNTPATWVGGTVPTSTDDVVIKHAVTISQPGASYSYFQVKTLTIDTGGSLNATGAVSSTSYYTILSVGDRVVESRIDTTVGNIQFYDNNSGQDFVFRVASGTTLTLLNTAQGHFVRSVVKQGAGTLVWQSVPNLYPNVANGTYDDGPLRVEAGTFRMATSGGRDAGYALTVQGGAVLDLRTDFNTSSLSGQGQISRGAAGTSTLTMSGSSWSGTIADGNGTLVVSASGANTWSGENTFLGGLGLTGGTLDLSGTQAVADTCAVSVAGGATLNIVASERIGALSGAGSVTLPGTTLTVDHGAATPTFSGVVSGTGGLVVTGSSGALTLGGANTYTGGTTLDAGGTLVISSGANLGGVGGALAFNGGRLRLGAHVNLTSGAVATAVAGSGPSATIAAQGASPTNRTITVSANDGTIELGVYSLAVAGFDTAVGQDLTIIGNGTVAFNGADPALFVVCSGSNTWAGRLLAGSAFGFLCKQGAGSLAVTNSANTWSKRVVRAEAGTLLVGASGALGTVSDWLFVLPGATCRLDGVTYASAPTLYLSGTLGVSGTSNWQGPVSLWSDTPIIDVAAASDLTLSGAVSHSTATSLTKTGSGTLVLGATNSFALPVSVTAGTLSVAADDQLGNAANQITLDGGTLAATATFSSSRNFVLGASGGTCEVASGMTLTLAAPGVVGGTGQLRKIGQGSLVLDGTNTYDGGTAISSGVLSIAADANLGTSGAGLALDGGTLRSTASATLTGRPVAIGPAKGTIDATSGTLELPGVVSGNGTLAIAGSGMVALSGANTLVGEIQVTSGVLSARSANALGTAAGATVVANGATLNLAGTFTSAEPLQLTGAGVSSLGVIVSSSGDQTLSGTVSLVQSATPVLLSVANGATTTMSGVVSGAGGFAKAGAGTLSLTNTANSFTGQVTVGAGILAVGSGGAVAANGCLGATSNEVLLAGGTMRALVSITGTDRIVRIGNAGGTIDANSAVVTLRGIDTGPGQDLTLTGPGTIAFVIAYDEARNLSGRLLAPGAGTAATLDLSTSGAGTDPGTLVIANAANTWNGTCTVNSGRLVVNGQAPGSVSVASGATIAGSGTVGDLSVATGATVSPGALLAGGASTPAVLRAASLQLSTGAILRFELGTANDLLSIDGTATITGTPARPLFVTGSPTAAAFNGNTGDYVLLAAGTLTYDDGAVSTPTYGTGITTGALYRVTESGNSLVLQRNRAPVVSTGVADAGGTGSVDTTTTPPSYEAGPPGSVANFNDDVAGSDVIRLVRAVDPEGAAAADLLFTLRLDPSQGVIEWDASGAGAWQVVSADGPTTTWTQADIDAGRVRYRSTGTVGGNDAILYDVRDALAETSPLYLMRFTIQGNGPPVVANTPVTAVWSEQAAKPGAWAAVAPAATVQDSDAPLDGGLLQVTLLNPESGDELSFVGNGVTVSSGTVAVSGVAVGTLVATSSDLTVTLNGNATEARVAVLLRSASFRTSNDAPVAVQRSIRIQAKDGTVGGGTTIVAFPLNVDLYNDAPDLEVELTLNGSPVSVTSVPCVPGLARTGRVIPSDPEGESAGNMVMTLSQSTLQGTLSFTSATGAFTYTPNFVSGSLATDVLEDSFTITVTDRDFSVSPAPTRADGTGAAARYDAASRQVVVPIRIAASGGGTSLAFTSVPRMTVDPGTAGSFSFTPQMRLPSGSGTVTFELIDPPAGITLGSGSGEINFNPATGAISWPAVPAPPGPAPGYWRFGILATDPATGTATLLPVMLRVGSGGTNG